MEEKSGNIKKLLDISNENSTFGTILIRLIKTLYVMKTLTSVFVVAVAAMAMSCAGNANKKAAETVVDSAAVIETVVEDSVAVCGDSTVCADSTATK